MGYEPTPEQIAQADEKRLRRRAKRRCQTENEDGSARSLFLVRPWTQLHPRARSVKVMTWNLLAQCLVRSDLFPTSGKARKASVRVPMIHAEILSHNADILCMQEVDGLDKLLPALDHAGYTSSYASGPAKPHGCLIAYKTSMLRSIRETVIEYDRLEVHSNAELSSQARIGSSHQTKNIANIVALQGTGPESVERGYIIATTHLFWHPAYTYERVRQVGLLVREVTAYRELWQLRDWPCIIAGDFNFSPGDPAYTLLVGEPLSLEQQERLQASRVVHVSIDPTVPVSVAKEVDKEGGKEESDPDRVIRNSRESKPSDGLLSDTELSTLFEHRLWSVYDEGQRASLLDGNDVATYGARESLSTEIAGACEPLWTSFTHYWRATLDYIFVLDSSESRVSVTGYLQPHRTEDVVRGLPQIGVCGSDHFSLCAELATTHNGTT